MSGCRMFFGETLLRPISSESVTSKNKGLIERRTRRSTPALPSASFSVAISAVSIVPVVVAAAGAGAEVGVLAAAVLRL